MAHHLDYASPALSRRFDSVTWPQLCRRGGALVISAFLTATSARLIPGGPFISAFANVVPTLVCLAVIILSWRSLRRASGFRRAVIALLILCASSIIRVVADDVMTFWLRPYARGALFGW